jgi:hypothetical protein
LSSILDAVGRLGRLNAEQRLALIGVAAIVISLFLPWWRSPTDDNLVLTGWGDFGPIEAALLLTAAAVLFLLLELARDYAPPRPLSEGGLLIAGGVWAAVIVTYRMFDRPEFTLGGADEPYELHYGIAVALGGATLIFAAGLRRRWEERARKLERPAQPPRPSRP